MALTFEDYQLAAKGTDQVPLSSMESPLARERALMVPLLGLAGESGSLLTEYKKWLREGDAYILFKDQIAEEPGDVLWYITNLASKAGLSIFEWADFMRAQGVTRVCCLLDAGQLADFPVSRRPSSAIAS